MSSEAERLAYDRLIALARAGAVGSDPYEADLSVVVQQIFSLLFGSPRGLETEQLWSYFEGFCAREEWEAIVRHLQAGDLVERRGERWYASTQVMDMGEKGRLHSNIPDRSARKVVDATSGQVVGEVADIVDEVFALGGRMWQTTEDRGPVIYARPARRASMAPIFRTHQPRGAFFRYLPDAVKRGYTKRGAG